MALERTNHFCIKYPHCSHSSLNQIYRPQFPEPSETAEHSRASALPLHATMPRPHIYIHPANAVLRLSMATMLRPHIYIHPATKILEAKLADAKPLFYTGDDHEAVQVWSDPNPSFKKRRANQ